MKFNYRNIKELVIGWARKDAQLHEALSRLDKSVTEISQFLNEPIFPKLEVGNLFFSTDRNNLNQGSAMTQTCRIKNNAAQLVDALVFTVVLFNTVEFDTDGMTLTANRITFKTAGYYSFGFNVTIDPAGKDGILFFFVNKNGSTTILQETRRTSSVGYDSVNVASLYYFNQNDYIDLTLYHDDTSPKNVTAFNDYSAMLWAHRLS